MVQFKQQQRRRKQKTIGPTVAQDFKTVHAASVEGGRGKGTLAKSGNVVVHRVLRHAAGPVQEDLDARHVHVAKEHGARPQKRGAVQIVQHCDAIEKSVQPPVFVRRRGGPGVGSDGGTFDRQLWEIAIVGQVVGKIEDGRPPGVDLQSNDPVVGHLGRLLLDSKTQLLPVGRADGPRFENGIHRCVQCTGFGQIFVFVEHSGRWFGHQFANGGHRDFVRQ